MALLLATIAFALAGSVTVAGGARTIPPLALAAKCRGVPAIIGGVRRCLRPGQRCNRRFDRQYHRYRFHCHSGRLTRFPKRQPPAPPPPFNFGAPTNLTLNSAGFDGGPTISDDGLSLFFISERAGGQGGGDIWTAMRASTSEAFGSPVTLGPVVNGPWNDGAPSVSSDGLSLYFDSDPSRPGGHGSGDIWVTTRPSTSAPFGPPLNLGPTINDAFAAGHPDISSDGLSLYFSSGRPGSCGASDVWVATRPTPAAAFGPPRNLGSTVNSCAADEEPNISADGLTLFFSSDRAGGSGMQDLWVATRSSTSAPFGRPVNLGRTVNSSSDDRTPDVASDGTSLYFMSTRPGGAGFFDLWESRRTP